MTLALSEFSQLLPKAQNLSGRSQKRGGASQMVGTVSQHSTPCFSSPQSLVSSHSPFITSQSSSCKHAWAAPEALVLAAESGQLHQTYWFPAFPSTPTPDLFPAAVIVSSDPLPVCELTRLAFPIPSTLFSFFFCFSNVNSGCFSPSPGQES